MYCGARIYTGNEIGVFDERKLEFWLKFLTRSWGWEYIAGGFLVMVGVTAGHPLDTHDLFAAASGEGMGNAF